MLVMKISIAFSGRYCQLDNNHADRLLKYKKWENDLNFDGMTVPVSLKAIDKFERQNLD